MVRWWLPFLLGVLATVACAAREPEPPTVPLRKRAAIDLRCDVSEITMASDDDQVWQVRGCERSGYYVKQCGQCLDPLTLAAGIPITSRCGCEWVLTKGPMR